MDDEVTIAPPEPSSPDRGRRIGPYKIVATLGEGGFGTVYLAEQERPVRRRVALKIIKAGMDSGQVLARFDAERQALALMDHPHIARVLDGGTTETGSPYFVMDFVKGEPITAYCDRHQLPIDARLALFAQVCDAVQHAHGKGIIHRDLKPGNILVTSGDTAPEVKVIDFGIAKAMSGQLTDHTIVTEQFMMIGTLAYMSPEQAEGSPDLDTRTDIYSLGVVLYELLTGSTPFDTNTVRAASLGAVQRAIREDEPERPSMRVSRAGATITTLAKHRGVDARRLMARMRGELDWITLKALEKDRLRRYQTANALALDVQRYLAGEAVLAVPPTTAYRVAKFVRRHTVAVVAAALVAATLVAATGVSLYFARQARQRATAEAAARARSDAISGFITEMLQSANLDLGGQQDLTVSDAIAAGVRRIDTGAFRNDPETAAALYTSIAGVMVSNDRREDAVALSEKALALRRALAPSGSVDVIDSLVDFSASAIFTDHVEDAGAAAAEALRMQQRIAPGDHRRASRIYTALADVRAHQEKWAESEVSARLGIAAGEGGAATPNEMSEVLDSLGRAQQALGHFGDSAASFEQALAYLRAAGEAESRGAAVLMSNIASVRYSAGDLVDAAQRFREALALKRRIYTLDSDHREIAANLSSLATVLLAEDQPGEAEPLLVEALETFRRGLGDDAPETLRTRQILADAWTDLGRADRAARDLQDVLGIRRRYSQYSKADLAVNDMFLARAYHALGRRGDEREMFAQAVMIMRAMLPARAVTLARILWRSGSARFEDGDITGAIPELTEAVTIAETILDPAGPQLKKYRDTLAKAKR